MKRFLQNAALLLISSLVALAGIEIGLRLFAEDAIAIGDQYVFYKFDPVLGWSNLPNSDGEFNRFEFSYPISINADGMRDAPIAEKRPDEFRVAVQGDSYVWGVGAADGERFTEVLEKLDPKINALNFGVSGYGPIQYLLQLDEVLKKKPDYVLVVFCLSNDLPNNIQSNPYGYTKPYGKLSPDGLKLEIAGYPLRESRGIGPALRGVGSNFRILAMLKLWIGGIRQKRDEVMPIEWEDFYKDEKSLTPEARGKVEFAYKVDGLILDEMAKKVASAIGPDRFAVLLAPTKAEAGLQPEVPPGNENMVMERMLADLARLGITAIDGRQAGIVQSDFWRNDGHWRASGNEKTGELLARFFADRMSVGQAVETAGTAQ